MMDFGKNLDPQLAKINEQIRGYAQEFGLDLFDVIFQVLDWDQLNQVAAYAGFPGRYPHWQFGMEYEYLRKSYAYGLSKIYEMVINNDPAYAYLLEANHLVDQKLVMSHVFGHVDFFKNNFCFAHTNRRMIDEMANYGSRIRRYMDRFGWGTVEDFLTWCLSIDNLIDYHSVFAPRRSPETALDTEPEESTIHKLKSKEYMDPYINPPEFIEAQRRKLEEEKQRKKHFPERSERDVLLFLIEHAPLESWQRDVLSIVRSEAYYFAPQRQTKVTNEGWASYWHSTIMTQRALDPNELIDYADHHAGTMGTSPGQLNPYKLGLELLRDIEERWNKGQFGRDWEECDDMRERANWDKQLGLGRQKIFEVRRLYNDVTLIDTFLTPEFCRKHQLFVYRYNPHRDVYEISNRDFEKIKRQLLFSFTNFGQPIVDIADANYANRGELYLVHRHEGVDLELGRARDTLHNLRRIWGRPVHLETIVTGHRVLLSYGEEFSAQDIGRG